MPEREPTSQLVELAKVLGWVLMGVAAVIVAVAILVNAIHDTGPA